MMQVLDWLIYGFDNKYESSRVILISLAEFQVS